MIISNKKDLSQFLFLGMEDSIVLSRQASSENDWNLTQGCRRFPYLVLPRWYIIYVYICFVLDQRTVLD